MATLKINILIKESINANNNSALDGFRYFLSIINRCDKNFTALYAQGETLEEALENKIIGVDGYINPDYEKFVGEDIPVASSLWNCNVNDSISIIFVRFSETLTDVSISIRNPPKEYNENNIYSLIKAIADKFHIEYLSITFAGDGVGRKVFPDRPGVGWMLYLPVKIKKDTIKKADKLVDVASTLNNGTIIITKSLYDPLSVEHTTASNDIEVALVELGLLPLYKDYK